MKSELSCGVIETKVIEVLIYMYDQRRPVSVLCDIKLIKRQHLTIKEAFEMSHEVEMTNHQYHLTF